MLTWTRELAQVIFLNVAEVERNQPVGINGTIRKRINMKRVYNLSDLQGNSKAELQRKIESVQTNGDLTVEEKDKNIDVLNIALNGGVRHTNKDALDLIKEVEPDIDDIEGN